MLLRHLRFQFEALQVTRGAPGTNRAEFLREGEELSQDLDRLVSRNGRDHTKRFREIVQALTTLDASIRCEDKVGASLWCTSCGSGH